MAVKTAGWLNKERDLKKNPVNSSAFDLSRATLSHGPFLRALVVSLSLQFMLPGWHTTCAVDGDVADAKPVAEIPLKKPTITRDQGNPIIRPEMISGKDQGAPAGWNIGP